MTSKPATHRVSLPPVGIPLVCVNGRKIQTLTPWLRHTLQSEPEWHKMSPGDIVMLIKAEFIRQARFETHDQWKLTFYHKGEKVQYLWETHEIFVPQGRALNNWLDFWRELKLGENGNPIL